MVLAVLIALWPVTNAGAQTAVPKVPTRALGARQIESPAASIASPLGRIDNRLSTRIDARLPTRLDQNSSIPQTVTGSIETANQTARQTRQPR